VRRAFARQTIPAITTSLPRDFSPVTGCHFLAYSCAAARDSHPLPSSSVLMRVREPKYVGKEQKLALWEFTRPCRESQLRDPRHCRCMLCSPECCISKSMIPKDLLDILVCPNCKKSLALKENGEGLKCGACQRVYPIRDNIPILLIDEAVTDPA
jgi:uncharacterized protein